MSDDGFEHAVEGIPSQVIDGAVYVDADLILALNGGLAMSLLESVRLGNPTPPEFVLGMGVVMDLYQQVHDSLLARHAAGMVPDDASSIDE
jgi:hypothetical protein